MVGAGNGGEESLLARVSIVNVYGNAVYDKYVLPTEPVTDYRTRWSGIREGDLVPGSHKTFTFSRNLIHFS
jgi:RNA exonuclease 4